MADTLITATRSLSMRTARNGTAAFVQSVTRKLQQKGQGLSMKSKWWMVSTLMLGLYVAWPYTYVESAVSPHFVHYLNDVRKHCSHSQYFYPGQIVVKLGTLGAPMSGGKQIGYCKKSVNRFEVVLDKTFWDQASHADRYKVVAHELSHCMLKAQHSENEHDFMYGISRSATQAEIEQQVSKYLKDTCT